MNTHIELKETAAYQAVRMRATGIANTIWAAATEVMAQIECATLDADEATTVQLDNMIRAHLANIYPELLRSDDLPNIQTKRLRVELDTSSQPRSQVWRPTRPALARGIAMLIEDGRLVRERAGLEQKFFSEGASEKKVCQPTPTPLDHSVNLSTCQVCGDNLLLSRGSTVIGGARTTPGLVR